MWTNSRAWRLDESIGSGVWTGRRGVPARRDARVDGTNLQSRDVDRSGDDELHALGHVRYVLLEYGVDLPFETGRWTG